MKIEVRDLAVRYGRRTAVDGVSFEVEPGSVWALLGRNGAGKSSLVKVLLGQRPANRGTVSIGGLDPWRRRATLMARLGPRRGAGARGGGRPAAPRRRRQTHRPAFRSARSRASRRRSTRAGTGSASTLVSSASEYRRGRSSASSRAGSGGS